MMQVHMRKYESSGQTATAYCNKHNLSQATFYYWRRRLSQPEKPDKVRVQEIQVTPGSTVPIISIEFPQGATIRIEGSISASFLRELVGC